MVVLCTFLCCKSFIYRNTLIEFERSEDDLYLRACVVVLQVFQLNLIYTLTFHLCITLQRQLWLSLLTMNTFHYL